MIGFDGVMGLVLSSLLSEADLGCNMLRDRLVAPVESN